MVQLKKHNSFWAPCYVNNSKNYYEMGWGECWQEEVEVERGQDGFFWKGNIWSKS